MCNDPLNWYNIGINITRPKSGHGHCRVLAYRSGAAGIDLASVNLGERQKNHL